MEVQLNFAVLEETKHKKVILKQTL